MAIQVDANKLLISRDIAIKANQNTTRHNRKSNYKNFLNSSNCKNIKTYNSREIDLYMKDYAGADNHKTS
ncbi:hypothetical protein [Psychroserpens luteus]|uniref:Uncharacterized protein n=1 Tax=Psychroserpens luteus TaxID=1434066 RepID=A0ABW5ZUR2_9FLAO|nr:hypothetical protein [Psychroserpens luteus]